MLARLPLVMSIGIGLCVNQTRAVLEALAGKETEFVRTPKHGIGASDSSWWSKKYRSAKSVTPFIELGMAAYFVVAIAVAFDHGHYLSLPFLGLFLCGFGYVGWVSLWQGGVGARDAPHVRRPGRPRGSSVVVPPACCTARSSTSAARPSRARSSSPTPRSAPPKRRLISPLRCVAGRGSA